MVFRIQLNKLMKKAPYILEIILPMMMSIMSSINMKNSLKIARTKE